MNLNDAPYQTCQLLGIGYGACPFLKTAEAAVKSAADTPGPPWRRSSPMWLAKKTGVAHFVMGDFTEPSRLGWTASAVKTGVRPKVVVWFFTKDLAGAGLIHSVRTICPDAVAKPGLTWPPTTRASDQTNHLDRITSSSSAARLPR